MRKTKSGFTIVELLIVIVVVAILAAISVIAYQGVNTRAKNSNVATKAQNFQKSIENFNTINGRYPGTGEMLNTSGATLIGLQASDLDLPDEPVGWPGIQCPYVIAPDEKRLCYISHPNADGSGSTCETPTICQSYKIEYVDRLTSQTVRLYNTGHRGF